MFTAASNSAFFGTPCLHRLKARDGLMQWRRNRLQLRRFGHRYRLGMPGVEESGVRIVVVHRPVGQLPVALEEYLLSGE